VAVVGCSMFMYSMVVAAVIPDPLNPEIEVKLKTSIITIAGESSRCYMEIGVGDSSQVGHYLPWMEAKTQSYKKSLNPKRLYKL